MCVCVCVCVCKTGKSPMIKWDCVKKHKLTKEVPLAADCVVIKIFDKQMLSECRHIYKFLMCHFPPD